ncbi:hypothetical protein AVEN_133858-1 [Araneus ventricosus]|uniref:Uncharacterized protein n=1 Tax=Araneus ventricosus TaxID=182803 RepID=A0A4Y2N901_ARAVE|nr:hypothetical protein AVEN_133858-1 [Araneus ventricosus]
MMKTTPEVAPLLLQTSSLYHLILPNKSRPPPAGGAGLSPLVLYRPCTLLGRFDSVDSAENGVQQWLSSLAASFFEEGIDKLVSRYDKCLNNGSNYVEE